MNNIIQRIDTKLVNPFDISQHEDEKMLLINIATGTVTPPEVSESLRATCCNGHLYLCKIEKIDFLKICQEEGFY